MGGLDLKMLDFFIFIFLINRVFFAQLLEDGKFRPLSWCSFEMFQKIGTISKAVLFHATPKDSRQLLAVSPKLAATEELMHMAIKRTFRPFQKKNYFLSLNLPLRRMLLLALASRCY